jgi:hypothetical protein
MNNSNIKIAKNCYGTVQGPFLQKRKRKKKLRSDQKYSAKILKKEHNTSNFEMNWDEDTLVIKKKRDVIDEWD